MITIYERSWNANNCGDPELPTALQAYAALTAKGFHVTLESRFCPLNTNVGADATTDAERQAADDVYEWHRRATDPDLINCRCGARSCKYCQGNGEDNPDAPPLPLRGIRGYSIVRKDGSRQRVAGSDVRGMARVLELLDTLVEASGEGRQRVAVNTTRNTLALVLRTMRETE